MTSERPQLAMCSWVSKSYEDVLRFALGLGFDAVELDCDEKPIPATKRSRDKLREVLNHYELKLFYHSPFLDQALGSANQFIRGNTINTLKMYLDFLEELEADYLVVHAGIDEEECPRQNVIEDMQRLVELAEAKSITLCIENLRFGLSSEPQSLLELAKECGSKITFDLGHANSCSWTSDQKRSSKDFLRIIEGRVVSAHVYLKEQGGRHHPFTKLEEVKETLDYLRNLGGVKWWTIELPNLEDVIREKSMLEHYFNSEYH